MSSVPSTNFRELAVEFPDRKELVKNFLGETPFGGLAVNVEDPLEVGEVVQLHVLCHEDQCEEKPRGVVLWQRISKRQGTVAGIGFFASEVDKRERLLAAKERIPSAVERKDARHPIILKVSYDSPRDFMEDYTKNISAGGIFVESKNPLEVGLELLVRLHPPGHPIPIDLPAKVTWIKPNSGFGVRFLKTDRSERDRLHQLVQSINSVMSSTLDPELVA